MLVPARVRRWPRRHFASQAVIVSRDGKPSRYASRNVGSPEKRNAARNPSSTATVLQIRGIAQINKSRLCVLAAAG